ncbi:transglutaminaseTgpA domain-containing protein [Cellulomonas sp. URHD0024]|uniref:DUF3488 and transglutaminase-like domain-containing protein n=1 Tax=Cellulomonas sp. URHD0024 TaxID=1302620 RepID=UPI0004153EEE|nr:transglutaminaseTgpA domain-containing protein [Cellulomonas sp. URHD0024]
MATTTQDRWGGRPVGPVAVELALGALSVAVAALAFTPYFFGWGWTARVGGAVLVGTALAAASAWWRWAGWLSALAGLVAVYLYALFALHGVPKPSALAATGTDLLSGWDRMLTVTLPADPGPQSLALPAAAALTAAFVTGLLVLRTAAVTSLALPAVGVLVLALALTAARGQSQTGVTVGLAVVLAALILLRANSVRSADAGSGGRAAEEALDRAVGADAAGARRTSSAGRVLLGIPGVALVVAVAAALVLTVPIVPGTHRADPRDSHKPQIDQSFGLSPLVELKPQMTGPSSALYTVSVTGPGADRVDRIRLAALDDFDGALWSQSGTFVRAGTKLPEAAAPARSSDPVTLAVEVTSRRSPYLPVVGETRTISGTSVAIDESSGSVVRAEAADSSGPKAVRYTATADVASTVGIDKAVPPPSEPRLKALPHAPEWVRQQADLARGTAASPKAQLDALQSYLRTRAYDPTAKAGNSYAAVRRTLVGEKATPGYAEQYASAFAILARSMGYPSRVAFGYLLRDKEKTGSTYKVSTTDAFAWPEVLLDGYGWVAFDPTDTRNLADPQPQEPEDQPVIPDNPAAAQPAQPDQAAGNGGTEVGGGVVTRIVRTSVVTVSVLVLLLLLLMAAVVGGKLLRRGRRRTGGTASRQISAAWRETTDRLREQGIPVPPSWTPIEVARAARPHLPEGAADDVAELAVVATNAVFAPSAPGPAAARNAWRLEGTVRTAIAAATPLAVRLRTWLDPRPLLDPSGRRSRATTLEPAEREGARARA